MDKSVKYRAVWFYSLFKFSSNWFYDKMGMFLFLVAANIPAEIEDVQVPCSFRRDDMIPVGRDEILPGFTGISAVIYTLHKLYPTITYEKFHSGKAESPLCKKCPYSELFWSKFSRIRTEYGEIRSIKGCSWIYSL